ncbi:lipopolysaccharide biosynthesis protein [Roseivirga sp. E12]|uniref:lipopolysaccharide biosynthesis protein n=1 Tax=Roseivirga sp. E12 TaxID=2819237 RepID=UPI001ABD3DBA|nr:lipopolysaccharide biosynthesis protein [Roseivirga sp. E12]
MTKKLTKDIVLYGVVGGLGKFLMLILVPVYTNVFSPEEYGVVDLVTTTIVFFAAVGMLQMEASTGRYYFEVGEENRSRLIFTSLLALLGWTFLLVTPLFIWAEGFGILLFESNEYTGIIRLACLIIIIGNGFYYLMAIMRFVQKPIQYGQIHLVQISFTLTFSILLVVFSRYGIQGVFLGQIIGLSVGLTFLLYNLNKWGLLSTHWNTQYLKNNLKYSLPLIPGVLANWANRFYNRFVVLGLLSLSEVGILSFGMKVAMIVTLLEEAVKMTWSPFVFKNLNKEGHRQMYINAFQHLTRISFSLVILLTLLLPEIIGLLAPEEYQGTIDLAIILVVVYGVRSMQQIVAIGPGISKKTFYNSLLGIGSLVINISFLYILTPSMGLIGVGLSIAATYLFRFTAAWIVSERLYPIGYPLTAFIGFFFLACLTAATVIFLKPDLFYRGFLGACLTMALLFKYRKYINKESLKTFLQ